MSEIKELSEVEKKARVFAERATLIFIRTPRSNGTTRNLNGYITEIHADFFIITELNNIEIPIFFSELENKDVIFEPSHIQLNKKRGKDEKEV